MHQLRWKQYCQAVGLTPARFRNLAYGDDKNPLAYAFGEMPADMPKGRYFDIDAAVARIGLDLAPGIGQSEAMNIVRISGAAALNAIAWADYTDAPIFFAVAEGEINGAKCFQVASGPFDSRFERLVVGVRNSKGEEGPTTRITFVNVTEVLRRVRANAAAANLDLSDPFLPAPDSVAFAELLSAGRKMDDERLTAIRAELSQVTA